MNGIQLTERFIEDLQRSIEIRNSVPDVLTQVKQTNSDSDNLGDFVPALNAISFDAHLPIVVGLINSSGHSAGVDANNISGVLEYVTENREQISENIQNILDNDNFISVDDGKPISGFLVEELNTLHSYSGRRLD